MPRVWREKDREGCVLPCRFIWILSGLLELKIILLYLRLIYAPTGRGEYMRFPVGIKVSGPSEMKDACDGPTD